MEQATDQVRGGTGRSATFLELFFDLVYVFAVTQVVSFIHHEPTLLGLAQGALLLVLLWWTWSIYTWTTNWTGTASVSIQLFLLAAMGATLVMSVAVPEALGAKSELFGISLFAVRVLAAGLYYTASKDFPVQRAAFMTFFPLSFVAAVAYLVGGFLPGGWLIVAFIAGAFIDVVSALNAGRGAWAVDADHFSERNGLFVIIVLGESIVGLGLTAAEVPADPTHLLTLVAAFSMVAAVWWAYFDQAAPYAKAELKRLTGKARGRLARDVYSLLHQPFVIGVVFMAVALEDVIAHPTEALPAIPRFALGGGVALALAAIAAGSLRVNRYVRAELWVTAAVLVIGSLVNLPVSALVFTFLVVGVVVIALVVESTEPMVA